MIHACTSHKSRVIKLFLCIPTFLINRYMILSQNSNNSYSSGLLSDIILIVNLPSSQEPEHYFLLYPTGTFSELAVHFFAVLLRCWFTKHKMKVEQTYKVENKLFRVLEIWDFIRYKVRIYNKTVMCYVKYYIV